MANETRCDERFYVDDPFVVCSLPAGHEGEHRCGDHFAWSEPLMLRTLTPVSEPQPTLSAAVQTLEKLVTKWRATKATLGGFYPEASAYADGQDSARESCADELSEALAHLPRQREGS